MTIQAIEKIGFRHLSEAYFIPLKRKYLAAS
jgi:hypothetical protein